jgi:hypothetical protein
MRASGHCEESCFTALITASSATQRLWRTMNGSGRDMANGRLPEQIEYTAVSAVGFNATKTKAIVYMSSRFPYHEALMAMELTNGIWTVSPGACVGVA